MQDIEIYEINGGIRKAVSEFDFGQAIVGRKPIVRSFVIKATNKIDELILTVKELTDIKMIIQDQLVQKDDEILLADKLIPGESVTLNVQVEPLKGGYFSPGLELKYLTVPGGVS